MKLEKQEIRNLRPFMESKNYDIIKDIVKRYSVFLREQNADGGSEYDTIRLLFSREGKIQGLKEFFEMLEVEVLGNTND